MWDVTVGGSVTSLDRILSSDYPVGEGEIFYGHLSEILAFENENGRPKKPIGTDDLHTLFDGVTARLDSAYGAYGNDGFRHTTSLRQTIDIVDFVDRTLCHDELEDKQDSDTRTASELIVEMYVSAAEQRYAELSSHALRFMESSRSMLSRTKEAGECVSEGMDDCPSVDESISSSDAALERLLVFASAIARAESSAEVVDIMNLFFDPVGSFSTKRKSGAHIAIGSYVGLSAGGEGIGVWDHYVGAAIPVGIEFGVGTGGCCSVGFFLSPVDLGVVASYLFSEEEVREPRIGLEQLLAPSVYFILGLDERFPLALGIGGQYVRGLRTKGENEFRVGVMFAIDVTLLRLY